MWFLLLAVAAFAALGTCEHDFEEQSFRHDVIVAKPDLKCKQKVCSCLCPTSECPPCPLPYPMECYRSCGSQKCPCPSGVTGITPPNQPKKKNSEEQLLRAEEEDEARVYAVSTVNSHMNGPLCSGFNLRPNVIITFSACLTGRDKNDLFVTVNGRDSSSVPLIGARKVLQIISPNPAVKVGPVALIVEKNSKAQQTTDYLRYPERIVDENQLAEIYKWKVLHREKYEPMKMAVEDHWLCGKPEGSSVCLTRPEGAYMGWNDIGTPLVEVLPEGTVVHGMYTGSNIFMYPESLEYMALYPYRDWLKKLTNTAF